MTSTFRKPIGAALVVGAGIAGVQAALDLAESEIKVYLLERSPAIGGKMAQLDKTFPTNDCAMCIISPKLVEAGRHRNIEIITTADLLRLEGEAGHFTATILRRPRYVDTEKCTACNDCVEVCPIHAPSEFNQGLAERTAVFKPYAQAVPNAYAVTKRGTSPCKYTCPADTSAQGYIALIAEGRYEEALEVIKQYNPFPATVGRVCHHPCESECNRGKVDQPVAICALKRFVADTVYARRDAKGTQGNSGELRELAPFPLAPTELPSEDRRRIAVVGSGPCGLTTAYFLVRMGYQPTIFEALPVPGGMMRVGIPAYRLPRQVLRQEIDEILRLGVELKLNHAVRDINHLFDEGYSAVFLAIGAHEPQLLGIPGEDARGVFQGVPFLRSISLGEEIRLGERVVVVGGGNTAIDTARTAVRMGSREVTILYRRGRAEMPANSWEVDDAEAEGVRLELLAQPIEVLSDNPSASSGQSGRISGVRCIRMRLGEPDASGRRRPIPIEGSEFVIECDTMVAAVAQAPEISFLDPDHGLEITRWGTFKVDSQTLATNRAGVFAGGDAAAGPGALIEAIAAGRRGALSIDRHLREVPLLTPRELTPLPVAELTDHEIAEMRAQGEVDLRPRETMPTAPAEERARDFREVELGLTEEQAHAEALRCLHCGLCSECYQCVLACKVGAIDHQQAPYEHELKVGAVVLAPGYQLFNPERYSALGYGRYPNVVTSMQFERLLSASGPTGGHVARLSDHQEPKRIAFLQCIGSRDREHDYCSAVCCMYATKEATLATEHLPGVECQVFLMDMRAFGKGFDAYFQRAQTQYGIRYVRSRVPAIAEDPTTHNLRLVYETEDGQLHKDDFDLVVLSVGMEPPAGVKALAQTADIELDKWGFCQTETFKPVQTSRPGVFVCGAFAEPKDIPESVTQASGAAAAALSVIGTERGTLVEEKVYRPEIPVAITDEPRIGVFICSCGSNIAGVVDVDAVVDYAKTLPNIAHAENTIYTCSADSLKLIQERIAEHGLNRVIVSSCTPRTHEPIFRETIREAGLNPYLFEMANIRDQCSWVHSSQPEAATQKANDLTRMAVGRSRWLMPLYTAPQALSHEALVIGGGVAGMTAALNLAEQGFGVYLVEREKELGGRLRQIYYTADGSDPQAYLSELVAKVQVNPRIEVLTGYQVAKFSGFVGNFKTTVKSANRQISKSANQQKTSERLIEHGVTIVATGGQEYRGAAYLLGQDPRVMTQGDLESRLALENPKSEIRNPKSVVMIQCVGPWDEGDDMPFYCSRVCCGVAIKNALRLKELDPDCNVYILYKDVRTYGFSEALYTEARQKGVIFLRYDDDNKPDVQLSTTSSPSIPPNSGGEAPISNLQPPTSNLQSPTSNLQPPTSNRLQVSVFEPILGQRLVFTPDLLVLSSAVVPAEGNRDLAGLLKFSCTLEGFFLEAHLKLRPVDFPAEGIFLCGVAHYPKFIDETIAQAQAAAARAATVLSKEALEVGGMVAVVDEEKCTGCLTCVRVCPYEVPRINPTKVGAGDIMGVAEIEAAACQGCGTCAGECPAKAIQLQHYRDEQVLAKEEALFEELLAA